MRRIPGTIINGGGGVATGAASGVLEYPHRKLYWANPIVWRADRFTRVTISVAYSTTVDVHVSIRGAQDGDRLMCVFGESNPGLAENVIFDGVNIGAWANIQARIDAEYASNPYFQAAPPEGKSWKNATLFFLKTRGQIYLTRVYWPEFQAVV